MKAPVIVRLTNSEGSQTYPCLGFLEENALCGRLVKDDTVPVRRNVDDGRIAPVPRATLALLHQDLDVVADLERIRGRWLVDRTATSTG